ncbi:MAG TPA: hypothetical protein VEK39_09540 [Solirubrobacterales bacterium]|nr:hypothetical protein [Solirubrobacterales bacterium]
MRPRPGWIRGLAALLLACASSIGFAACGSDEDEPPGTTPGDVEPIGELAGPTVPLDESGGFDNVLALTVETTGEGRTLIAGQIELARPASPPEIRIVVDGKEERDAEARQTAGGDSIVIACGCELQPGEHDVELQGRSTAGAVPIAARSLVALDGVEYASEPQNGSGPLPAALNGAVLETSPVLVSAAPTSLADLDVSGAAGGDNTLIVAQVGSTRSTVDPAGISLEAGVGGEEADRLASIIAASTKVEAFGLGSAASPGSSVDLLGHVIGGGSTEVNLVSVISCPCGLETES